MFHVGQKVVCVDASAAKDGYVPPVNEGAVYTVADVEASDPSDLGITLFEVTLPIRRGYGPFWKASRFRPVVERKTDISDLVRIADEAARTGRVFA